MAGNDSIFPRFSSRAVRRLSTGLILCVLTTEGQATADALEDAMRAFDRGDMSTAFHVFERLAEQGNATAQFYLGDMYDYGKGTHEDDAAAVRWYRMAAEQGHAEAQNNLGWMHANGHGVPEDNAEAVHWFRMAARQGHAWAQNNLGLVYANGHGVPEDDAEAVCWFRMAAGQGLAEAQNNLGWMHANGHGVPEDDAVAVRLYRMAAGQGHAEAQYGLGLAYAQGMGIPKDDAEAVRWLRKATEQGHVDAQNYLGRMETDPPDRVQYPAGSPEAMFGALEGVVRELAGVEYDPLYEPLRGRDIDLAAIYDRFGAKQEPSSYFDLLGWGWADRLVRLGPANILTDSNMNRQLEALPDEAKAALTQPGHFCMERPEGYSCKDFIRALGLKRMYAQALASVGLPAEHNPDYLDNLSTMQHYFRYWHWPDRLGSGQSRRTLLHERHQEMAILHPEKGVDYKRCLSGFLDKVEEAELHRDFLVFVIDRSRNYCYESAFEVEDMEYEP